MMVIKRTTLTRIRVEGLTLIELIARGGADWRTGGDCDADVCQLP